MTLEEQSANFLKEAKRLLDGLEIPFCLFLGTALGAYRDKKFCDGDEDDIDLAIEGKYYSRIEEIKEAFKNYNNSHHWKPDDGNCQEISFEIGGGKNRTKIDIFFISEIDGKAAWKFYPHDNPNQAVTKVIDKKFIEKFDKIMFYGEEFNIPSDIEGYLKANYGDWKTPLHRRVFTWQNNNDCEIYEDTTC